MKVIQWIPAGVLFLYFLGVAATNATTILRYYWRGEKGSLLPFFGGIAGVLAFLVVPINGAQAWCWLPLVLDFWTLPSAFFWLRRKIKRADNHQK